MNIRFATLNDVEALAFINYTSWIETYRGIVDDSYLDSLNNTEQLKVKWRGFFNTVSDSKFLFVLENDEAEVVGYCCVGKARRPELNLDMEVLSLYLLKKYHGKGWGKALLVRSVNEMGEHGFKSFYLLALKENPSTLFYRSFKPGLEEVVKIKMGEREYDEILMGWNDLENFKPVQSTQKP